MQAPGFPALDTLGRAGGRGFTLTLWLKVTSRTYTSNWHSPILGAMHVPNGVATGWGLWRKGSRRLTWSLSGWGGAPPNVGTSVDLKPDTWQHVAVVFKPPPTSTSAGRATVYVDGVAARPSPFFMY